MKSKYHEITKVVVRFVKSERIKQEKKKAITSSCLFLA